MKLQNKFDGRLYPLNMKQNITKELYVCVAVYKLLTALLALELSPSELEILKHMWSMQYQFRGFKNMDCFISLHRHCLDKAVML